MNGRSQQAGPDRSDESSTSAKRSRRTAMLVFGVVGFGVLMVLALVFKPTTGSQPVTEAIPADRLQQLAKNQTAAQKSERKNAAEEDQKPPRKGRATAGNSQPQPQPQVAPHLRQLVSNLSSIDLSSGAMTPQQVAQWKQNLQQLIQQGAAAVPAIREFLDRNLDLDFRPIADTRYVGYDTLRLGMIDALQQIGGPEALGAALQTLQTTADPAEIAMLAKNLIQQSPADYRETALTAALETLNQAMAGGLGNRDMNPVFELLQRYGDASVVADLEKAAAQWNQYSAMALAGLPEGAGIPSLIRLAEDTAGASSGSREAAIRLLAQVAIRSPEAGSALLEQVRLNAVQNSAWPTIAAALSGLSLRYGNRVFPDPTVSQADTQTYHVSTGNQTLRGVTPAAMDPEQILQRIGYIDQLLAVTTNPVAVSVLHGARNSLITRPQR